MPRKKDADGHDLIRFTAICQVADEDGKTEVIPLKLDQYFRRSKEALHYIEKAWRPILPRGKKLVLVYSICEARYQNKNLQEKRRALGLQLATA